MDIWREEEELRNPQNTHYFVYFTLLKSRLMVAMVIKATTSFHKATSARDSNLGGTWIQTSRHAI